MEKPESENRLTCQLACYQVRPEALERCLAAIQEVEFVDYEQVASNSK